MARALIARAMALAEQAPDRPAVRCADDGLVRTRSEVIREAGRLASILDQVTTSGSTILVEGPAGAGFHAAILAVWGSGRRALPIGALTSEDLEGLIRAHRPGARILTEPGTKTSGGEQLPALVVEFDGIHETDALDRGEHASLLLQSSGTVGHPRLSLRAAKALDLVASTLLQTIGMKEEDRVLSALPMHHAYGIEHAVMMPILAGAEVIQMRGLSIDIASGLLRDDATILPSVPPTIEALGHAPIPGSSLRLTYTAGSPLPEKTRLRFESAWGVKVGDLYGASEVGTISWGFDACNRPVEGVEVAVADDGELLVRSNAMFEGYLDETDCDPSRDRITDGWFLTGDLGRLEDDGVVRVVGRARLQFDVGGLKVNPTEVEDVLREHPAISDILVGPLPLSETVNRVQARIVVEESSTRDRQALLAEIRAWARERLPAHQVPRQFHLVPALPRTASGKLIRRPAAHASR